MVKKIKVTYQILYFASLRLSLFEMHELFYYDMTLEGYNIPL